MDILDQFPSGGYTSFPVAESLRSFASTVALDDGGPLRNESRLSNRPDQWSDGHSRADDLLSDFPHPPKSSHAVDTTVKDGNQLTSKPSIKTLRRNYIVHELPLLQELNPYDGSNQFNPVNADGVSYDLIAPYDGEEAPLHSLEKLGDLMFSSEHMLAILNSPRYLSQFRDFLLDERPQSLPSLTYYLNARKALQAIKYANSLVRLSIDVPTAKINTTDSPIGPTTNAALERRVEEALLALTAEELPAFITSNCIRITSKVVEERVRGTLPKRFRGTSDALAEVFCLTDPSRPDNPIIFASEEFHRTTQYGMDYVLGRNCRFLQGPKTNPNSVRRIREAIEAGRHHSELFLNYRRDGSPFMNLLQCAPLCDSSGKIRYFIGAQIDVSGLAMDGAQMESLQKLQEQQRKVEGDDGQRTISSASEYSMLPKSEFQEMCELFSPRELINVQENGGNLFNPTANARYSTRSSRPWPVPDSSSESDIEAVIRESAAKSSLLRGSLIGAYGNYLLVRPYPSLAILFTSPSLQIPGILQTSFFSRIGSSSVIKDQLLEAMKAGRSVTARIKWVTRYNTEGRHRWVHCTPLLASNGEVGVWMVIVVDDDEDEVKWMGNWPTTG
ncbi:uncharacterized protein ACLA_074360 [Aspergillus clavatus NRRL 1]|uniref:PAC domain-containing protein n=1 Tax=Aspergillus clavatus (strain ATCC 1007 / CBS 513.65 / DSM 816 / NCTC 3887 / NRRL 1 / QM 1276 / 107) TaxID=344612 RepID=A1C7M8_ASPCL|nr:uncharacterized protein ACLA_074360 [Aspergillus clavatus NRRL 1]EAW14399.1 conserved hypothetical protein [Aspergillus clavatus NRRL 1]